jgi:hypothetical protein
MITSPTYELETEERKDERYEIKRIEVDIGVLLLIGKLGASPKPTAHKLQTDEISTSEIFETDRIDIKVLSAQR